MSCTSVKQDRQACCFVVMVGHVTGLKGGVNLMHFGVSASQSHGILTVLDASVTLLRTHRLQYELLLLRACATNASALAWLVVRQQSIAKLQHP